MNQVNEGQAQWSSVSNCIQWLAHRQRFGHSVLLRWNALSQLLLQQRPFDVWPRRIVDDQATNSGIRHSRAHAASCVE